MPDPAVGLIPSQNFGPIATDRSADARPPPAGHQRSSQQSSEKPPQATRACERCRQMKVKCEGSDNPPCVRCNKAGKECQFIVFSKSRNHDVRDGPPSRKRARVLEPMSRSATDEPSGSTWEVDQITPIQQPDSAQPNTSHVSASSKSSRPGSSSRNGFDASPPSPGSAVASNIPSSPPMPQWATVNEHNVDIPEPSHLKATETSLVSRRQGQQAIFNNSKSLPLEEDVKIPKRDLRGMIKIFCEKLLPNIPVLDIEDIQDADHLIETDLPLVYCICYVTAKFLSRGEHLREMLMPKVSQVLKGGMRENNEISTLKSLIILYRYADCSTPSLDDAEETRSNTVLYWPVKSVVELYALRLGLNRSAFDLRAALDLDRPDREMVSDSYQKYTFWLLLFTMAKSASLVTETHPSIPLDITIRMAPGLMEETGMRGQHGRLYAEAELAILWEKVSAKSALREWWCPPDPSRVIESHETELVLLEANGLIEAWYDEWADIIHDEEGQGAILDFRGRSCRFWVYYYATKHIQSSSAMDVGEIEQVRACAKQAIRVLDWPLDLSPFEKETLRYIPESEKIMITFCCLFIVASYQTFWTTLVDMHANLDKVDAAAQLMMDMDTAHVQGPIIFRRTAALRKQAGDPKIARQDAAKENENYWDFSLLTPRLW